ncbi:MAG: outer membrane beta-barrel protein [Gemmatimonadaceae bacterium]
MHNHSLIVLAFAALPTVVHAQAASRDTTIKVTFGGFVDSYYAYDFGRPASFDRSFASGATFTTQPARHNEFNINLAYVEANLSGNRLRGRLSLQAGTSVQSNYAGEPTHGSVSGPTLGRHIQEAFAGYQVTPHLWIDGGVFYSHIGVESWASRDNPTYTRSLVADYSPYYSSGVRATWQATPRLAARLDVINGWQNISETNSDKGAGIRLDFNATPTATVSYYNFINNEAGGRLRVFNGAGTKLTSGRTTFLGELDYGSLGAPSSGGGASTWWGFTAVARQQVSAKVAVSGRVEGFNDRDQVSINTGLTDPFRGSGVSGGIDVTPQSRFVWRLEARGFFADAPIFPSGTASPRKNGGFVVSSLALTF